MIEPDIDIRQVVQPEDKREQGNQLRGSNPIHGSESKNNFVVNPLENVAYCWRQNHCQGGGPLYWIAVREGLLDCGDNPQELRGDLFRKTVEVANNKYGANIQLEDKDEEEYERQNKIKKILNQITELCQRELTEEQKEEIMEKRDLTEETIDQAQIGYFNDQVDQALRNRYTRQELIDTGIYMEVGEDNKLWPILQDRIAIPYTSYNQTWFFIGRKTKESQDSKYKKIKETEYNKHPVWQHREDNDKVIITEGIYDAISVMQAGYSVISPITPKWKKEHIDKVSKQAKHYDHVYIAMDGDKAGQEGQRKTANKLTKAGTEPHLIELEDGMDLDDWTTENGYDLEELFEEAPRYLDTLIEKLEDADKREKPEIKKQIFDVVADWSEIDRNPILNSIPGNKRETKKEFKKHTKNTELTETTEPTEQHNTKEESGAVTVQDLMDQEEPIKKRPTGIVNDTFYMTTWFYDKGQYRKAVITSDKQVIPVYNKKKVKRKEYDKDEWENIPKEQKQAWDYDFFHLNGEEVKFKNPIPEKPDEDLARPTNQVLKYLKGKATPPDKEDLFNNVKNFLKDYWDHFHGEWYDIVTAYIFHTYLTAPRAYTIYLYLHGEPDTGKTTLQKTKSFLEYNGVPPGNVNPTTAVRLAHSFQASINMEEPDKEAKEAKKEIAKFFNTGYRKGGTYKQTNIDRQDEHKQVRTFYSFNPKTFSANSVYGWADSFESRCLFLKCMSKSDKELGNPDKILNNRKEKVEKLRNQITAYTLLNWKDIEQDIEAVSDNLSVSGRKNDKLALFVGLVKHFLGEERSTKVKNRIKDAEDLTGLNDINERDRKVLEYLINEFNEDKDAEQLRLKYKKIRDYVNEELGLEEDGEGKKKETSSRAVGSKLKSYDLLRDSSMKVKDGEGDTCIEAQRDILVDSLERYDLVELRDMLVRKGTHNGEDTEEPSPSAPSAPSAQSDGPGKKEILGFIEDRGGRTSYTEIFKEFQELDNDILDEMINKGEIAEPAGSAGAEVAIPDG